MSTKLSRQESWDGEHPSEIALSCLADGQLDAVDAEVRDHAEGCAECTMRVGEMALESHAVGAALVQLRDAEAGRHRFPFAMTATAAVLALVCALPGLTDAVPRVVPWIFAAPRLVPLLATPLVAVAHDFGTSPLGRATSVAGAVILCLIGFALARGSRARAERKA